MEDGRLDKEYDKRLFIDYQGRGKVRERDKKISISQRG
jgi:hypothetical protein